MAILPVRLYPDPVLRVECPAVEHFDRALERLALDMIETMRAAPGVGLAAPQVGVELRLAVVDASLDDEEEEREEKAYVLVNPEIVTREGTVVDLEGCLSIPGLTGKVARPARVEVRARDLEGEPIEMQAQGLVARAICHEIDHLDGVLFVDRMTGLRKEQAKRVLRRMRREAEVTS